MSFKIAEILFNSLREGVLEGNRGRESGKEKEERTVVGVRMGKREPSLLNEPLWIS